MRRRPARERYGVSCPSMTAIRAPRTLDGVGKTHSECIDLALRKRLYEIGVLGRVEEGNRRASFLQPRVLLTLEGRPNLESNIRAIEQLITANERRARSLVRSVGELGLRAGAALDQDLLEALLPE